MMKNTGLMDGREYQSLLPVYLNKLKMKNSFKPEEEEDNKDKIDGKETDVDSLPIHCVVKTVSRIEDVKSGECQYCDDHARTNGRSWWDCECNNVEMSGCVVVPEDTSINDVIKTVLTKLGYPTVFSSYASGFILIRNWKPLPLKSICPGMNKTVGDIFGELTAIVSLRIQIFRPPMTMLESIKDNLLNYLVRANQSFLNDSGCPFDMGILLKFCSSSHTNRKQFLHEPSNEIQEKFEAWLKHVQETGMEMTKSRIQHHPPASDNHFPDRRETKYRNSGGNNLGTGLNRSTNSETGENYARESGKDKSTSFVKDNSFGSIEKAKPSPAPKTRIRTSFDPELELPKLHKWYLENPHPSRQQIYEYVTELNLLESRKGKKPLDVNNVLYWFKNARAAQKRTECRKVSTPAPGGSSAGRANVLKIPLGKMSGISSDDQRSLSEDEISVTSETAEDYGNRSDRCLQVVGKWNSNGQGEAVLEMQIGSSHKNEFVQSSASTVKKEQKKENGMEECSRSANLSTDEDSIDPVQRHSPSEKKAALFPEPAAENDGKETDELTLTDKSKNEIRNTERSRGGKGKYLSLGDKESDVSSPKTQLRSRFSLFKDSEVPNESNFLPSYNSGISNIFEHSLVCMSQYMSSKPNNLPLTADERRKRNRTFIDPVTEVPRLEEWFRLSTHPSHNLIARYTDELNSMPYRKKFPKLETKNVQFWFKNRRAKNKRLNYLEVNK